MQLRKKYPPAARLWQLSHAEHFPYALKLEDRTLPPRQRRWRFV